MSNRNSPTSTKTPTNVEKEIAFLKSSKVFSSEEKASLLSIVSKENANKNTVEKVAKNLGKEFENGEFSMAYLRSIIELAVKHHLGMEQLIPLVIIINAKLIV